MLTIGFARRMATYKRMSLIIHDPERTARLLTNDERPVQFVLAGKAHPFDNEAKRNFQELARWKRPIEHLGRIVYLENYEVSLARFLVQGCDVWLNLPRRPLEASGTSGQKVIANGGLNCSILDGWWCEGFDESNGWAIGTELDDGNPDAQDNADAEALIASSRTRSCRSSTSATARGIPRGWLTRVRASMRSLLGLQHRRMVLEYARVSQRSERGARIHFERRGPEVGRGARLPRPKSIGLLPDRRTALSPSSCGKRVVRDQSRR